MKATELVVDVAKDGTKLAASTALSVGDAAVNVVVKDDLVVKDGSNTSKFYANDQHMIYVTPLFMAHYNKCNRSINILLKYMARIDKNCSFTFKDFFADLITYSSFLHYTESL